MTSRITTGVPGLDEILHGGLLSSRAYLVSGTPGTGKTILGLQFLAQSDSSLFISFTQTEEHLREDASALGIALDNISFLDLTPEADVFSEVQSYDIFSPVEVEREPIARSMRAKIEELNPQRIFVDGFSELRMISADMFHFLRIVQSFFRFATGRGATVLVSAALGLTDIDVALQATTDGVIRLSGRRQARYLEVVKLRGGDFVPGRHAMRITSSGLEILPEAA
jgi:circadian clock protein KaiC